MHAKGGGREGAEGLQKSPLLGRDVQEQMVGPVTQSGCQTLCSQVPSGLGLSFHSAQVVCILSVWGLSLPFLRLPGGWVAFSFPHSFFLLSLLFLDRLVLSLQGPTLCRGKQIISFVSNWCCALIQQLRTGMLPLLFNKLLHSPC